MAVDKEELVQRAKLAEQVKDFFAIIFAKILYYFFAGWALWRHGSGDEVGDRDGGGVEQWRKKFVVGRLQKCCGGEEVSIWGVLISGQFLNCDLLAA